VAAGPILDPVAFFKTIGYKPHEQQWLYHKSRARFRLPNCGRRFGKSTMAGRDLEPKLFAPKKTFWIIGPTYDLGEKEFRVIWDDLILKMQLGKDKRVKRAYNKKQGNMFLEFPWGTRVEVRSADHPENLVGEALDWVIMSEAAKHKEETWQRFIRPALADKRGGADFPTTPEGYNWLYGLWMLGQNPEEPDYESWRFPSWANTVVYPGGEDDPEIKLLKRTMSPESFLQEIGADFGSFTGKIYPDWDVQKHVTNVKFNPAWPNYIAFDWGYTNPLAAIEFQISPRDEVFIWREHYKAFATLPEHVRMLKEREQPPGYHLDMGFGDAADPEAIEYMSVNLVPTIGMPEAKTNWRSGTDLVASFMKDVEYDTDEFGAPLERPRFFVDYSCENVIHEFNNYKANESVKGKNVPEMGQKVEDHTIDAIRYGLVHIYQLGATYHLTDVMSPPAFPAPLVVPAGDPSVGSFGLLPQDSGFFTSEATF
jgi:hypothetical protein